MFPAKNKNSDLHTSDRKGITNWQCAMHQEFVWLWSGQSIFLASIIWFIPTCSQITIVDMHLLFILFPHSSIPTTCLLCNHCTLYPCNSYMNTLIWVFIIFECAHTKFQYVGVMAQGDNGSSTMSSAQAIGLLKFSSVQFRAPSGWTWTWTYCHQSEPEPKPELNQVELVQ